MIEVSEWTTSPRYAGGTSSLLTPVSQKGRKAYSKSKVAKHKKIDMLTPISNVGEYIFSSNYLQNLIICKFNWLAVLINHSMNSFSTNQLYIMNSLFPFIFSLSHDQVLLYLSNGQYLMEYWHSNLAFQARRQVIVLLQLVLVVMIAP